MENNNSHKAVEAHRKNISDTFLYIFSIFIIIVILLKMLIKNCIN